MIKLIIFDYDGVIVNSFPIIHEIYKKICKDLGKKCPEDIENFRRVYGNNSLDCYKNLGLSEQEKIIVNQIVREERPKYEVKIFKGIVKVLKSLHKKYNLGVMSSSYREEVVQKLKKYELLSFFDFILTRENHHLGRYNKTEPIKKIIEKEKFKLDEILLIGDRNVDFIEGTDAGLKNILLVDYGWGYDAKQISDYKLNISIKKPSDLLKAIKMFD